MKLTLVAIKTTPRKVVFTETNNPQDPLIESLYISKAAFPKGFVLGYTQVEVIIPD